MSLCALCVAACVAEKPSRSECIVKVEPLAPHAPRFNEPDLLRLMPAARSLDIPLAGYAVASPDAFYMQFGARCGDRLAMSRRLLSDAFPKGGISVREETITPGPATIDISGNSWRD
jgi:hypothetical protein